MELKKEIDAMLEANREIKVVSFDIFDTILFRLVRKPTDVFAYAARKAKKLGGLNSCIPDGTYEKIRIEAQRRAYEKKNKKEVTLDDIYRMLPGHIGDKEVCKKAEVEAEIALCYLNPLIPDLFNHLLETGRKIILLSDMYLPAAALERILEENGLDVSLLDHIFVSGEIGKNKSGREAFYHVLDQYGIESKQLLHIGDNYKCDFLNAREAGCHAIHYDAISGEEAPMLAFESLKYGRLGDCLYSIRKFCLSAGADREEFSEWFSLGAGVLGPVMTAYCEWILDTACENHILNIFPLMREGELIGRLLRQAMEFRNEKEIKIKPLYVSRKSVFLPSVNALNEENIEELLFGKFSLCRLEKARLGDLFHLLEVEDEANQFQEYYSLQVKEVRESKERYAGLREKLCAFFLTDQMKNRIMKRVRKETELITEYFHQEGILEHRCITVDFGARGTIQRGLEHILRKRNRSNKNIHLLLNADEEALDSIFEGIDLRGFVNFCGNGNEWTDPLFQRFAPFEQTVIGCRGTTLSYRRKGKEIEPVLENVTGAALLERKKESCWQGILYFQKMFLNLREKPVLRDFLGDKGAMMSILNRLYLMPTPEEAQMLGSLKHDENFGTAYRSEICTSEQVALLQRQNAEYLDDRHIPEGMLWREGSITLAFPFFYLEKEIKRSGSPYEKDIFCLAKRAYAAKAKRAVIIGAGQAGRKLYDYLKLFRIDTVAFMDNNEELQGTYIEGVPILPLQCISDFDIIIIGSLAFAAKLMGQVKAVFGEKVNIICAADSNED